MTFLPAPEAGAFAAVVAATLLDVEAVLVVAVELGELDPVVLLELLVADLAVALEDADVAELLIEFAEEEAEVAEEAEEAEEAVVMLAVADALELAVIDSTVFLLSTTNWPV